MSASSSATTARRARRHNERSILAELRRAGAASKPDIARRIALTPQAVNGIFDKLLDAGLIREGGRRVGEVGHPSTLYAISPTGAYAVGIDLGPRRVEIALVDFAGRLVYRALSDCPRPDRTIVRKALAEGLGKVWHHAGLAGIDTGRIVGIGMTEPPGSAGMLAADAAAIADLVPAPEGLPVHVERAAVVGALSMSLLAETPLPRAFAYLAIGETVDSCLVLEGALFRGSHGRAGQFGALPVPRPPGAAPAAMRGRKGRAAQVPAAQELVALREVASFAALRGRLAMAGFQAGGTEDFYRAVHACPGIVAQWNREAGDAVFLGLQAAQACLDLEGVFLCIDPPNAIGDRIAERLRAGFASFSASGLDAPLVRRVHPPTASLATGAAALALHEHFVPRLDRLTAPPEAVQAGREPMAGAA